MTSDASSSGSGGWPGQPGNGGTDPAGQWGQQPAQPQQSGSPWGQQPSQPQQSGSQWGQQPSQPQPWGQPGSQWAPTLPSAWEAGDPWGSDSYPVDVRFTPDGRIGRYWGIPIVGQWIRGLCLIPHAFVLIFVYIVAALASLFTWIPILFTGRQAHWAYALVGGYIRWSVRYQTWGSLLSGTYPPFTGAESDGQHVRVRIDEDQRINRFWGIPLVGWLVRIILLIPHFFVLLFLWLGTALVLLFAWLPVLAFGRQADLVYNIAGGTIRWTTRVGAYAGLLSGPYPPFRLD